MTFNYNYIHMLILGTTIIIKQISPTIKIKCHQKKKNKKKIH